VVRRQTVARPNSGVVLLQALLKGKALETVLEKSVELGVEQLVLLETDHCVAQVPPAEAARKRSVWTQTLIEAAKQSRNPWLPELLGPMSLAQAFQQWSDSSAARLFVASLEPGVPTLGRVLHSTETPTLFRRLAVAIGPEGDFSPSELANFRSAGAVPISLGSLILRAETAAIAAVAILADHARGLDHAPNSSATASTTS
jgi:16S rRNA (uracil1498-N3)-methyltransferase